jgi:hypothetical protein
MVIAGLAFTVAGWLAQIYRTVFKKENRLCPTFLGLYAVGCILLTIGNFTSDDVTGGALNLIDVILPLIILWTIVFVRRAAQ